MADENQNEPGFFQSLKNFIVGAGQEIAQDNSSGGSSGGAIRSVSDSQGAEPLWAAWRQGGDELGQALKAFPDSIQAHAEPGQLFEPLYSDIVAGRDNGTQPLPSPSQIANDGNAVATVESPAQQAEQPRAMTPSEIANDGNAVATVYGPDRQADNTQMPTPSEIAQDRGQAGERIPLGPWTQQEIERTQKGDEGGNANDQNEQKEQRSLANEQETGPEPLGRSPHLVKLPEGTFFHGIADVPRQAVLGAVPEAGIRLELPPDFLLPPADELEGLRRASSSPTRRLGCRCPAWAV